MYKKGIDSIKGGIMGFLIGDALGLPVAGLRKEEADKRFKRIKEYVTNFHHPFFYFLKKGQYGSNSQMLITILQSLFKRKKFDVKNVTLSLKRLALKSKDDFFFSRWFGVTTMKAILSGNPAIGHSTTCVFRSIPIALYSKDLNSALKWSEEQSKITHYSPVSLAGSFFVTYLLFHLKQRSSLSSKDIVIDAIIAMEKKYHRIQLLTDQLRLILSGTIYSIEQARRVFGTSSFAFQTIPMAVYIFLRHEKDFETAILLGANSFRQDSPEEKERLKHLSYIEELIECRGGATDGIAGLVGSFIGCNLGYSTIPLRFLRNLENRQKLVSMIENHSDFIL